jgi:hypothetical protein
VEEVVELVSGDEQRISIPKGSFELSSGPARGHHDDARFSFEGVGTREFDDGVAKGL